MRDKKVIERIAAIYEKQGSDCWFTDDPKVFLGDEYDPEEYQKLNENFLMVSTIYYYMFF